MKLTILILLFIWILCAIRLIKTPSSAHLYVDNNMLKRNILISEALIERKAKSDDKFATFSMFLFDNAKGNYKGAYSWLSKSADLGNKNASSLLQLIESRDALKRTYK